MGQQPVFQTLPLSNPTPPTDIYSEPIQAGDVIVYGVGRGGIDFGIVDDIIYKVEKQWIYDPHTNKSSQQDGWGISIKVAKKMEKYTVNKFVRLTGTGHIFVLKGERADDVRKDIEDSWAQPVDDTF